MVFYSILTFFIGPVLIKPVLDGNPNIDVYGFILGFVISVGLWMKFGRNYVTK
tara:strand:- start:231 stop:389 length:159 start_codon:yes stop_codon:yes gene_type:complete